MGQRGPVSKFAKEAPRTVKDLTPPSVLTGEALAFWERNSGVIRAAEDIDPFVLLCFLWVDSFSLDGRQRGDAMRQFNSLSRQFGMTPDSRRRIATSNQDRDADAPLFEFE